MQSPLGAAMDLEENMSQDYQIAHGADHECPSNFFE